MKSAPPRPPDLIFRQTWTKRNPSGREQVDFRRITHPGFKIGAVQAVTVV